MTKDINEEKNFNNFLIVQYTGGAGGRAICSCIQTAENIVPWFKSLPNPVEFALKHTNDLTHVRSEPDAEYKLPWLSRTYGVERGNDLSKEAVNDLLDENKDLQQISKGKKYILIDWHKHQLPKWFEGKCIQIINDPSSVSWLIERRKKLFYVESEDGVIETRYDSRYHPRPERNDRRVSNLPLNDLASNQFEDEDIKVDPEHHQIQLSWLIAKKWPKIFNVLENAVGGKIDRVWSRTYLDSWHSKVVKNA